MLKMATLLLCVIFPTALKSADWPQFGGPQRTFQFDGDYTKIARSKFSESWRVTTGSGNSSVCIGQGTIYSHSSTPETEQVAAFSDIDGRKLWIKDLITPGRARIDREFGSGPHATPLLIEQRLVVATVVGGIVTLDAVTGRILWQRELWPQQGDDIPERGYSSSPIAYRGNVICFGGQTGRTVQMLRLTDGKPLWVRGNLECSYTSPMLTQIAGRDQLIILGGKQAVGIDPNNGTRLWTREVPTERFVNCTSPIVTETGIIYFATANGLRAIQVKKVEDQFVTEELWSNQLRVSQTTNILKIGETIVASKEGSILTGSDSGSGKLLWRSRKVGNCRLVGIGQGCVSIDDRGKLTCFRTEGSELKIDSQHQIVGRNIWASPAISSNLIIMRDGEDLIALDTIN